MAVSLPSRAPDHEIIWPATDGVYAAVELTGGLVFSERNPSRPGLEVGTDARGRYLAIPAGFRVATMVADVSGTPAGDRASMAAGWVESYTPGPHSVEDFNHDHRVDITGPWFTMTERWAWSIPPHGGDRLWWYRAGIDGPDSGRFDVQFTSRKFRAERGAGQSYSVEDPASGPPQSHDYSNTPGSVVATVPSQISLYRPYDTDPSPRLYRADFWYDLLPHTGMWSTQQVGTSGGTSGGWPLKHGTTGSWPLSHRNNRF